MNELAYLHQSDPAENDFDWDDEPETKIDPINSVNEAWRYIQECEGNVTDGEYLDLKTAIEVSLEQFNSVYEAIERKYNG